MSIRAYFKANISYFKQGAYDTNTKMYYFNNMCFKMKNSLAKKVASGARLGLGAPEA